ncbi:hypothetical protein OHD62_17260 [Mesorhizobium sp. YC-39]|nr:MULTISPECIES: hypothetical protein [unclassified Mesorhizobium]MCV3209592.1 hypothetical protein [Mesorhizobium sp. YC-2]MCV3230122.1 hypothetical protein [Mesorhizobium sp. YC-39]
MRELRTKVEAYFSGPGFWPFFIMMVVLFSPWFVVIAMLPCL